MNSIPIIDLDHALRPGDRRSDEVASQMRSAAMASGFFYIRDHGIDTALVEKQFALARELMALPAATRAALSLHNSPSMRGFDNVGAQTLDPTMRADVKEGFYCGMACPDDHPYVQAGYQTYGHNQWPVEVPGAASQCETYIQALRVVARRLMQLLARSLDLAEDHFDSAFRHPMITLRMLRYPPHPKHADAHTFGAGSHTDWGALTLLAQDPFGGLEVQMPDGSWLPAAPVPGSFVVNLGDMIPRWTNGLYHSNPHRVRNTHSNGESRYSIPFFYEPDYLARIEPVPGTVRPGVAPRFESCTAGEHLAAMYGRSYEPANRRP